MPDEMAKKAQKFYYKFVKMLKAPEKLVFFNRKSGRYFIDEKKWEF